mgnify:CR=1 FL=1
MSRGKEKRFYLSATAHFYLNYFTLLLNFLIFLTCKAS